MPADFWLAQAANGGYVGVLPSQTTLNEAETNHEGNRTKRRTYQEGGDKERRAEGSAEPGSAGGTMTIDECANYIIYKVTEDGRPLNVLKLQKLAYYAQAWHLAYHEKRLFQGAFQAWVHGPVNWALYTRFRNSHQLYGAVTIQDLPRGFNPDSIPEAERSLIDAVLDAYGGFSGSQLEELTHREDPWVRARGGLGPTERCETPIDERLMGAYYRARISAPGG